MKKEIYRVLVIGPTGSGKSQFCNFIQRDSKNSINKVGDSFDSCTKDPKSNIFFREEKQYEFIDTAGSADTSNNDEQNLEKLVNFLKEKKEIDYFILLLNFYADRVDQYTREYIYTFGKLFTPREFLTHLCIFFTKFPMKPTKKEETKRDKFIEDINKVLKKTFNIKEDEEIPRIDVFFIDTEIEEREEAYKKENQNKIDIMLKLMINNIERYNNSIDTTNLDSTGHNVEIRHKKDKAIIDNISKGIKLINNEKEEIIRLQKEIEIEENDGLKKKKEKELNEIKIMQEERIKLINRLKRNIEECDEREKKIKEDARKQKIDIKTFGKKYGLDILVTLLGISGLCITIFAPELTVLGSLLMGIVPIGHGSINIIKQIMNNFK